jgi:hypothetical protein
MASLSVSTVRLTPDTTSATVVGFGFSRTSPLC